MSDLEILINEYQTTIQAVEENQHNKFNQYAVVHHSNAIENSTLTLDETTLVLEYQQSPAGKPLHDVFMANDHYEALLYILDLAKNKSELSHEIICVLGSKIMKNTGGIVTGHNGSFDSSKGEYRTVIVRAGESIFPDPKKVLTLMTELISNINGAIKVVKTIDEIYNLSFDVHFQAVSIHPFSDGNGRFSRLLMNYIQAYHNVPLIYLFAEDKQEYFNALKSTRKNEDLNVFRYFMLKASSKCLKHQINEYENITNTIIPKDKDKGNLISVLF